MKNISNTPLNESVICPNYNRSRLKTRIVHLGFGAFHKAHQGVFTDDVVRTSASDWGICEVSLFSGQAMIEALKAQDCLYSVVEKGSEATDVRVVGIVTEAMHPALDGIETIIEKMAEPQVAIISMTVTEKGYCVDPATGHLDRQHPLIAADIGNPSEPKSALGYIVQALKLRRKRGLAPFSVMSCDNVQGNGQVVKRVVIDLARSQDEALADWIETHVTFPSTMVDRIVPATTEETFRDIASRLGVQDRCGISCEPFRQWVIEDHFVAGRPEWGIAGAQFVEDVTPYEEMKLRMLNGSHSFLAYLGYLGGYDYISETMRDSGYRKAAFDMMMQAQATSLNMPEGTNLEAYAELLIKRFANPALKHKTWQIAMDGSQKIPFRIGGSLRFHLKQGSDFRWLAAGIAGWMRYVAGIDEQGQEIDVRDPLAGSLREICDAHGLNVSVVPALLSVEAIFPPDIGQNLRVIEAVSTAYQSLVEHGARATVAAL
ncbi:mannitol dehydrogenase family protein [Vibrio mangrovi]|uniref:Fructuronate reductase n=1 Tax=Vibrio mangrovi TaxID=474394 RepID=A0A1Y6ISH8_9VIBR|nr:fructuronate reductase [Vibrio mangrovi]MDW6003459.1 fructuronate reductase [Vibrio mangrovi]SMR99750.1 Mannitol 2-dehydrogenase [Vibrio mangrovi]